jgi:hypothetical protein
MNIRRGSTKHFGHQVRITDHIGMRIEAMRHTRHRLLRMITPIALSTVVEQIPIIGHLYLELELRTKHAIILKDSKRPWTLFEHSDMALIAPTNGIGITVS